MNWITKEIAIKKVFSTPINATEIFQDISDTTQYLFKVLGKPFIELDTGLFEIIMDEHCPNKCKSRSVRLCKQYESSDSTRRVLEIQCLCCNENYLLYQELDGE